MEKKFFDTFFFDLSLHTINSKIMYPTLFEIEPIATEKMQKKVSTQNGAKDAISRYSGLRHKFEGLIALACNSFL